VDGRTGLTLATTPIVDPAITSALQSVGDTFVKTRGDIVAIARSGRIRWHHPTSAPGGFSVLRDVVVEGWIDRVAGRFGIAAYHPIDGKKLASIDLGSTHGWEAVERIDVLPDGPNEVVVSALFGIG
jgi:hypothetical protein